MYTSGDIYPEGKGGGLTEHGYHIQYGYAKSVKILGTRQVQASFWKLHLLYVKSMSYTTQQRMVK